MGMTHRTCPVCGQKLNVEAFPPTSPTGRFGIEGRSTMCVDCLSVRVDRKDLGTVDKMCQFLDVAFNPNVWIEKEAESEELGKVIMSYCEVMLREHYDEIDWMVANKVWEKTRSYIDMIGNLDVLKNDLILYLHHKWGVIDAFSLSHYLRMEEYERNVMKNHNFVDETKRDTVRKLATLSVLADVAIISGEQDKIKIYFDTYNKLLKESGIRTDEIAQEGAITSLAELVMYLEKTGFVANHKAYESRDIVDTTIDNMRQYVTRLFNDSRETVTEMYENAMLQTSAGTEITDDMVEGLYAGGEEDEIELEETLSEDELEKMFRGVENTYGKN